MIEALLPKNVVARAGVGRRRRHRFRADLMASLQHQHAEEREI